MKTWTRPKIKVQKFVPNFCTTTCYTDFYEGEAWVEDNNTYDSREDEFNLGYDYYKNNWPATYEGKTYIKIDSWNAFSGKDGRKRKSGYETNFYPTPLDEKGFGDWDYDEYQFEYIPRGGALYVIKINDVATILARRTNKNAS